MSTGQGGAVVLRPALSCPAGQDETTIPVLSCRSAERGSMQDRAGQDEIKSFFLLKNEHRTGRCGRPASCPVLFCRTGRKCNSCPVLPLSKTGVDAGQDRTG